jgi:hypothetical protein
MLSLVVKIKKKCQPKGVAVTVLVLSMTGWFFPPVSAEQECATDFFTRKTCRSFDVRNWDIGQTYDSRKDSETTTFWNGLSGPSGSQIWYRNPFDNDWMLIPTGGREALGNPAIHGFRCLIDLFGSIICKPNQPIPESSLDKNLSDQR